MLGAAMLNIIWVVRNIPSIPHTAAGRQKLLATVSYRQKLLTATLSYRQKPPLEQQSAF